MLRNVGKLKPGELLDLAVAARLRGQRDYAEYLYSVAETYLKPASLAAIAPLFRQGGPPRVTQKTHPAEKLPPEEEEAQPRGGTLKGALTVGGQPKPGVIMLIGGKRRPPRARAVELRDGKLAPHLLVVPVGSTVSFANFDPIFHNLFSLSATRPFDLGLYKGGEARDVVFDKEGVVRVSCNLHSHTAAYVIVVNAPYYAVSDENGQLELKNLAPGRYKVRAWSEVSPEPVVRQLDIRSGENHFAVDLPAGPVTAPTDKFGVPLP